MDYFHSERSANVFCPKPRRVERFMVGNEAIRPPRLSQCHQVDLSDLSAAAEILDVILTKDSYGCQNQLQGSLISCSPPYFCGSPPSRAANPLIHDARFLEEKSATPLTPPKFVLSTTPVSSSSSFRQGSCSRPSIKFSPNQATVRIEGFNCLNSDRLGCGIPAVA